MNLNELFTAQQELDDKIYEEKEVSKEQVFDRKIVALLTELFECVNEGRWFKYWSENTKPNVYENKKCGYCIGGELPFRKCEKCDGLGYHERNPFLEEFADIIHFAISLANDLGINKYEYIKTRPSDLNLLVIGITNSITVLAITRDKEVMRSILNNIITLGYQLGFNEETVIEAYYSKNKENHKRQVTGY